MAVNLAQLIADAWEHTMRTMPDPFRDDLLFMYLDGSGKRMSYRQQLDRRDINFYGEVIPRIERVRRNLRALGNIRLNPNRIPL